MIRALLGALALIFAAPVVAASGPTDRNATRETRALFTALRRLPPDQTLFGHQNDLAYGHDWTGVPGRSDVRDVAGAYPAVFGWDVMDIFAKGGAAIYDRAKADKLRAYIVDGYARGAMITMSWHMPNPVAESDAWDVKTPAVARIIPGGDTHAKFLARLDIAATFFKSLRGRDGRAIPIVFRPFHEHSGSWFWWGRDHATVADYVTLWRTTVERLRDRDGVHNLLYAYSTDVFDSPADYLERYPGDDVIDVLGFDDYHGIESVAALPRFEQRVRTVVSLAHDRGKIAAVTETGLEKLPNPTWWTEILGRGLTNAPGAAWVLVWRNADAAVEQREHFYAPYPGQASAADFVALVRSGRVLLADRLPDLYGRRRKP